MINNILSRFSNNIVVGTYYLCEYRFQGQDMPGMVRVSHCVRAT